MRKSMTPACVDIDKLPPIMTTRQAAELAGVTSRHICSLAERGDIDGIKLGSTWRIPRDKFLRRIGLLD